MSEQKTETSNHSDSHDNKAAEPVHSVLPPLQAQPPAPSSTTANYGGYYDRPPQSVHPDKLGKGAGVVVCVIVALMTGLIGFVIGTRLQGVSVTQPDYSQLNEVYNALAAKYDGKLDKQKLIEGAAKGMVAAAGDAYTEYMTASEYSELETELSGELNGIGVEIGLNGKSQLSVISTLDDSPAKKAGLQAGDLIVKIDDADATNLTTSQAAGKIRGEKGTKVKITVERDGKEKTFEITRDKIDNPSVKWSIKDGIGYIRISTFGEDTTDLAQQAAQDLKDKNVKGIILDLRDNTGGYVDAAQGVASLWLDKGAVITEERSDSKLISTVKATGGNILHDIPTVVLVNGATASASEITAGALRDSVGAKLVGTKTYGKGLVQEVVDLNNGDKLKVTIAKWYTPKGVNINKEGLEPDQKVDMTAEQYNSGNDTQRAKATEMLKK